MTDIVLIRPRYSLASSLYNKAGNGGAKEAYPPLGLHYLAASLRHEGFSVEIIDGLFSDRDDIFARIKVLAPRIIGISVVSSTLGEVSALIAGIRLIWRVPLVLGGPHITHCPGSVRAFSADFGIRGDAEESLCRLAKALLRGENNPQDVPGIVMYRDKPLVSDPAKVNDLDSLPFPEAPPAAESRYFFPLYSGPMTTMIASRGCPFDCVYCGLPNKRCFKPRGILNVLEEIRVNIGKGYRYIDFKDDIFTYDMPRIEELCRRIIEEKLVFGWGCETRADFLSDTLLDLMKEAGCSNIKLGIESSVLQTQRAIGKVIASGKIRSVFRAIRQRKMSVIAYFSIGHPEETLEAMRRTVRGMLELRPDYMDVTLCSPIPGSRLFDLAVEEGKLPGDFWSSAKAGLLPVYVPDGVSLEDMRRLQQAAYKKFYFNPAFMFRQLCVIRDFRELKDKAKIGWLLYKEACQ